jgi:hypothetical protein
VRDFGREIAHGAVSRRPPISLYTVVARTHMYTYAAKVWDLSIIQGPVSVAPRQTLINNNNNNNKKSRFATFCIAVPGPFERRELHFRLVEGDFDELYGRWVVDRVPSTAYACKLQYEVTVKPKRSNLIPGEVVTAIMHSGLPINLRAVRVTVIWLYGANRAVRVLARGMRDKAHTFAACMKPSVRDTYWAKARTGGIPYQGVLTIQ